MNKLQELSICISSTEKNVEITMSKENFDKVNYDLERKEKLEKAWKMVLKKKVDFRLLKRFDNANTYNYLYAQWYAYDPDYMDNQLTETEFNDLVEMLREIK